jgi:hypothetical protein
MAKVKSIRDNKNGALPAPNGTVPDSSKRIELTKDNAPLLAVKFLEEIRNEFRAMNTNLQRLHDDLQDIIADNRDV